MKRKQIALLLSLVLSVSPVVESAAVWGADFTDGTEIEQMQQEETAEEVFSAGEEQNMEVAAFSDEDGSSEESRYEAGLNYDTGTADLLPGHTVTVGVNLYWIHTDEDGNERHDNYEGDYQIKLKGDSETAYENGFVSAKVSEDGRSLVITAKGKDELDPEADNFGDIPISVLVDGEEIAEENVYISVRDGYHIIKIDDELEAGNVMVGLGDELDLSSYGIKTFYHDSDHVEGEEDPDVYYKVEYDGNVWDESGISENGLPVLRRKENEATELYITAWKQDEESGEEWQVSETRFWIRELNYETDLEFSYGSREQDILLYGEKAKPLTLTVVPSEQNEGNMNGFTVDWKVEQYVDNEDDENMVSADCVDFDISSSGKGINNDQITLKAKDGYNFANKDLRLQITAIISKDGKEVAATGTSLWLNEAAEEINFPGDENLLPGWGMGINSVYDGWKRDEESLWGTDIYAHVTGVNVNGPDGILTVDSDEEGNYYLQAAQNAGAGEFDVTLNYYTSDSEDREDGKTGDRTYTFHVSVKDEKYYAEYSYNSETSGEFSMLVPNTETVVTTSLYKQSYDIEEESYKDTEIQDYQIRLGKEEDGTPAWDEELVTVTVDAHKLLIKANNITGNTTIPVEFVVNGEVIFTGSVWIGVESDVHYISPEEFKDKDGNRLNVNVGETLNLSDCGITTQHLDADGNTETVPEDSIRYRVTWDKNAWDSSLKEGEYGLPKLTRTATYGTSIRVIAEKKFTDEDGNERWEDVNEKDYWFDDVYYDMGFAYGYGAEYDARVYTDKELTLTLQTEQKIDFSRDVIDVNWDVYRYNENGERISAEDIVDVKEKSKTRLSLIGKEGHNDENFWVEAVVTVDGKHICECTNELRVQEPVRYLIGESIYQQILNTPNSYAFYNKNDSGEIWMELYEENGECPDGKRTQVKVTDIEISDSSVLKKVEKEDRTELRPLKNGEAEITFSLKDKDGNKLNPVTITLAVVDTINWIESEVGLEGRSDSGELLPGESLNVKMTVISWNIDESGDTSKTLTEGTDYTLEYCDYDDNLISVDEKTGKVTANSERRGSTWLGIRAKDNDGNEIAYEGINISVTGRYYVIKAQDQDMNIQPDKKEQKTDLSTMRYGIKNPDGIQDTEGTFSVQNVPSFLKAYIKDNNTLVVSPNLDYSTADMGHTISVDIPVEYQKNGESVAVRTYTVTYYNHTAKETGRVWPSCGSSGYVNYKCETCGYTWQESLGSGYGHSWNSGVITKEPTCGTEGTKTYTCTDCGSTYTETIKATGEHKWDEGVVLKEASCTEEGVKTYTCTVCKEIKTESIPAAHTWSAWKTKSAATVLKEKVQERTCSVCQETETRTTGKKLTPKATLSAKSLKLKISQKTTAFKVTGMAKGDYIKSWKSSDKSIVKVSGKKDGTCTISAQKQTGTATITITFASGMKKTIKVRVQKSTVRTTAINGVVKKATLKKGKTLRLKPVLEPITSGEKVTYTSSDTKIAKVSKNGTVTALKPGTVTITVKSGKLTVTCKITVKK